MVISHLAISNPLGRLFLVSTQGSTYTLPNNKTHIGMDDTINILCALRANGLTLNPGLSVIGEPEISRTRGETRLIYPIQTLSHDALSGIPFLEHKWIDYKNRELFLQGDELRLLELLNPVIMSGLR
jgi:hypothetical protein